MASYHPLRSLYLARLREFYRQPARIFWVYGFPTLLGVGPRDGLPQAPAGRRTRPISSRIPPP